MSTMVGTIGAGRHGESQARVHAAGIRCGKSTVAKNIALFFAAPFIGLAYIVALPVVGTAVVVRLAFRSLA